MQSEKAVEIQYRFPGDVDSRTHGVVTGFAMWHDDVETVGRSALKDDDQTLVADAGISRAESGAGEEARKRGGADCG